VSLEILNRNRASLRLVPRGMMADVPAGPAEEELGATGEVAIAMTVLQQPERIFQACDQEVTEALVRLPPLERSILLLRAIGEFRYREIAEILSMPMGTVMGLLGRARARLRAELADYLHRRTAP
jgi:RNA polymerase sigma factor (sigma-70 family)